LELQERLCPVYFLFVEMEISIRDPIVDFVVIA